MRDKRAHSLRNQRQHTYDTALKPRRCARDLCKPRLSAAANSTDDDHDSRALHFAGALLCSTKSNEWHVCVLPKWGEATEIDCKLVVGVLMFIFAMALSFTYGQRQQLKFGWVMATSFQPRLSPGSCGCTSNLIYCQECAYQASKFVN